MPCSLLGPRCGDHTLARAPYHLRHSTKTCTSLWISSQTTPNLFHISVWMTRLRLRDLAYRIPAAIMPGLFQMLPVTLTRPWTPTHLLLVTPRTVLDSVLVRVPKALATVPGLFRHQKKKKKPTVCKDSSLSTSRSKSRPPWKAP